MTLMKTIHTPKRFSRRALLGGLGASAAFLPLLHAEPAHAATANGLPRRLVTVAWTNGVAQTMFYPASNVDPTASPILAPFAALKSKVLLAAGVDYSVMGTAHKYDGHFSYPVMFTGAYTNTGGQNSTSAGPSIDQVVSDAFAKSVTLKLPLMNIALNGNSTSYRAAGQRNTGENNAGRLFAALFASANLPATQVSSAIEAKKSVLDFVLGELSVFSKRMGTEDRAKIEAHLDAVRKLELRLGATPSAAACVAPSAPVGTEYENTVKSMMDIAGMAIRCDLTRVVSIVLGADGGSSPGSFPFLQVAGDYHGIATKAPAGTQPSRRSTPGITNRWPTWPRRSTGRLKAWARRSTIRSSW